MMLSVITVTVSEEFERFLELLGEKIELKGWQKYRGGLDVKSKLAFKPILAAIAVCLC